MRMTIIHPAIGHREGEQYIRSWQMEPLPVAAIAGLTPDDVDLRFYDDRLETIPYDEPTDAVVMSLETYTAKRAYQIASEYRARNVPVVVGGFHATLLPEEAEQYAEAVVTGEAEGIWAEVVDDLRHGTLKKRYAGTRPDLRNIRIDRSLFKGKRYLSIGLVETVRGCRFPCEFCAIQTFYDRSHRRRPVADVIEEVASLKDQRKLFFFVDDNFAANLKDAGPLLEELARLNVRWVTQMSINAAHDEAFLAGLKDSGCTGVLIGFESLDPATLHAMNKDFNLMKGGYSVALENLRRFDIKVYGTFVFGYEHDTPQSFEDSVRFASDQHFYIAAFNHLTPFPGTPLYKRLQQENKLLYEAWWLDDRYHYNDVPFRTASMEPGEITANCVEARKRFYSFRNILKRGMAPVNRSDWLMFRHFFPINLMHTFEIGQRDGHPLGDATWRGELLPATA